MPSTLLFATNSSGRVFALPTQGAAWREFLYLGLDFKKISAVRNFLWAVSGDRQVWVHVHGIDVPIRFKEEAYENERWLPLDGFSSRLLPTDRFNFSNIDGTVNRCTDKIQLPSLSWQWEGDWQLDCELDGDRLDHDGWTYALDFPAKFHPKKQWNSCVRRRKWFRYRRYQAMNSWAAVDPLHKDITKEPFNDVAVGGTNVPSAAPGLMLVWAITAHGRVMTRMGVSTGCPEGLRWTAVSTPGGSEVAQISVGPTGLVWACLFDGRALVRTGLTRDKVIGDNWIEVKAPAPGVRIVQVSVGTNAVWCVTSDNHVWFRRGVKGELSGISEDAALGSGWVEMVGNMSNVAVAHNDQVFAVGSENRAIYFRSGVSDSDLTGKKWRQIQCPMQLSRACSMASVNSRNSGSNGSPNSRHRSLSSLVRAPHPSHERGRVEEVCIVEEQSRSAPTHNLKHRPELWKKPLSPPEGASSLGGPSHQRLEEADEECLERTDSEEQMAFSAPIPEIHEARQSSRHRRSWSPVRSMGSVVGTEAMPDSDHVLFQSDTSRDSGVFGEDDDVAGDSQYWHDMDMIWTVCSAGAVFVEVTALPSWFNEAEVQVGRHELTEPWRLKIVDDLARQANKVNAMEEREKYVLAVDTSSWVKTGEARMAKLNGHFEECLIELEWVSASAAQDLDSGTLTILNPDGVTTKMQFSLSEITAVMCVSEPGAPRLAVHAPRLGGTSAVIKLQFPGDTDMEDWLSHLTSVCCKINGVSGRPSKNAVWTTTSLGDVFVFDPENLKRVQAKEDAAGSASYVQEYDLNVTETPYLVHLHNGMAPGSEITVTGCIYDDADYVRFDLQSHPTVRMRQSQRHVQLHLNPRFNEKEIVLNTMENSEWQMELRETRMVFTPGHEFRLRICSEATQFRIFVDGEEFVQFKHRSAPESVSSFFTSGRVKVFKVVYQATAPIIPLRDIFWRQIGGGHLKRVERCTKSGLVLGVGYDHTAWMYTGGWGGTYLKGLETSTTGINTITDTQNYYIYENQRWNPLSGYTTTGLPTDRHMWSDVTGKHKRSKEHTKLLSVHWQWISDWMVDFHTPGGVDRDGWQYAVDFPASYHGKKQFTDLVRRRRWFRRCKLTTSGPWQELGSSKLLDISIRTFGGAGGVEMRTVIWAVGASGDVLVRKGVSEAAISGTGWDHVSGEYAFISISCGADGKVWAIGKNGSAYFRCAVSSDNPHGDNWQQLATPPGVHFKQISAGRAGIWAVDANGRLAVRKEITSTFPEGSHWQTLPNVPNDPPHGDGTNMVGFKSVAVGKEVLAISNTGFICKRCGVTRMNPAGTGWNLGVAGNWQFSCTPDV